VKETELELKGGQQAAVDPMETARVLSALFAEGASGTPLSV
jgi:hypothetical protein